MRRTLPMLLTPRSIAFRMVALSTLLAIAAMLSIATLISTLYHNRTMKSADELLEAHLFHLIGAISVSEGRLAGLPNLGNLEFMRPASGYYWEVEAISDGLEGVLRSPSMTGTVAVAPLRQVPFDFNYRRFYDAEGLGGEELRVIEAEFVLESEENVARFRVMTNKSVLEADVREFSRRVYLFLLLFGTGMIIINALAILVALRPLGGLRESLARIREGEAERLDGDFPLEIAPLVSEANALIENTRRILERYRTQVGNLAHSLKTPLAVILNEGRAARDDRGRLIASQAALMQGQIDHYLRRARIASQRDSIAFRTPAAPVLQRMLRVFARLHPEKEFQLAAETEALFAGEREDLEELAGNLLENAAKWAGSLVRVDLLASERKDRFLLVVEDDGPGIPPEQARMALQRGNRLDETKPGSGLGLSIVLDLAAEYQGRLELGKAESGGLRATLELPGSLQ